MNLYVINSCVFVCLFVWWLAVFFSCILNTLFDAYAYFHDAYAYISQDKNQNL